MNKLIPALTLIFLNASAAMAQSQPYEESASNISSQRLVVEAVNLRANHPLMLDTPAPQAPAEPAVATGIGPSSNMQQSDGSGYGVMSDLRQLNF